MKLMIDINKVKAPTDSLNRFKRNAEAGLFDLRTIYLSAGMNAAAAALDQVKYANRAKFFESIIDTLMIAAHNDEYVCLALTDKLIANWAAGNVADNTLIDAARDIERKYEGINPDFLALCVAAVDLNETRSASIICDIAIKHLGEDDLREIFEECYK